MCRDAPLERLLSIHQSLERQALWIITNNIVPEKYEFLSLRDEGSIQGLLNNLKLLEFFFQPSQNFPGSEEAKATLGQS